MKTKRNMLTLKIQKREAKKNTSPIFTEGNIPGVLYGPKIESQPIVFSKRDFEKLYDTVGENEMFNASLDGKDYLALTRGVQKDSLTGEFRHVDFYNLPEDREIEVEIPIKYEGECPAEKEGGILVKSVQALTVKALPRNLVSSINIDLGWLKKIDDRITVKELTLPDGIDVQDDPSTVIAIIVAPKEEKIEETPTTVEDIELIKKEKKEEEIEGEEGEDKAEVKEK